MPTDHVSVAYTAADGSSHPLDSQTNGALTSFLTTPMIDGVPVRAATPMPIVAQPSANIMGKVGIDQTTPGLTNNITASDPLGHAQSITPNGFTRITPPGRKVFYEAFESGTFDTTNNWIAGVSGGGGVGVAVSVGTATIGTGTTPNGHARIESAASFAPVAPGLLNVAWAVQIPASLPTNTYAFWGCGTSPGSPTAAAPLTDAYGFEITAAGAFCAVCYAGGTRNLIATLVRPVDGAVHVYHTFFRGDFYWYTIDTVSNIVASQATGANGPNVNTLPLKAAAIAGTSAPSSSLVVSIASVTIGDTGDNAGMIADGDYPWRRATVTAAKQLVVLPRPTNTAGSATSVAVTTSSALLLAANTAKVALQIYNPSATVTMWISFGGTAAANAGGSIPITPLGWYNPPFGFVPSDQINAIAASGFNCTVIAA